MSNEEKYRDLAKQIEECRNATPPDKIDFDKLKLLEISLGKLEKKMKIGKNV